MTVSELYIYPIKSLGGISLNAVNITDRGFELDRRWMLVDDNNRFISQREHASLALLQVALLPGALRVYHKQNPWNQLEIQCQTAGDMVMVDLWDQICVGQLVSQQADAWFSKNLQINCRLVYMPESTRIPIDDRYNVNDSISSFSDGYPILMLSDASMRDLNSKLATPIPINRFRPNLVIKSETAFIEDSLKVFQIKDIDFFAVKPCARCLITTIDQDSAVAGKEPLKTLASYRQTEKKVLFGINVIAASKGKIKIGDPIYILQNNEKLF